MYHASDKRPKRTRFSTEVRPLHLACGTSQRILYCCEQLLLCLPSVEYDSVLRNFYWRKITGSRHHPNVRRISLVENHLLQTIIHHFSCLSKTWICKRKPVRCSRLTTWPYSIDSPSVTHYALLYTHTHNILLQYTIIYYVLHTLLHMLF